MTSANLTWLQVLHFGFESAGYIHAGAALHRVTEKLGEGAAYLPENAHLVREIAYYCPPAIEHQTFDFLLALHIFEGKRVDEVAKEIDRILAFRCHAYGPAAATLKAHGLDDWLTFEECIEQLKSITTLDPAERDALMNQAQEAERNKNYCEASYLMKFIAATRGKNMLMLPEHTELILKMVLNAPPDIATEFDAILLPPVTHVNAQGQPAFSLQQVANKLGSTVQELEERLEERPELKGLLQSGPASPLH